MNKKQYEYSEIMSIIGFTDDEIDEIKANFEKIKDTELYKSVESEINEKAPFGRIAGTVKQIAEAFGDDINLEYLTVTCANLMKSVENYRALGVSEEIIFDTLRDIKFKADVYKRISGKTGSFTFPWYGFFMYADIYKLGRLEYQFEPFCMADEYSKYGVTVKRGEKVLSVHIPEDGPLKPDDVDRSFKMAYEFFTDKLKDGYLTLQCGSWFMCPAYGYLYSENSNIRKFSEKFDIIGEDRTEKFTEVWRVFDTFSEDVSTYPLDTSMRRGFAEHIKKGGPFGHAKAVLFYKP